VNNLVSGQGDIQRSDACSRENMEQPASGWSADDRRVRAASGAVVEAVVRMNVGFIEHGAGSAGDACSVDNDLGRQGLV
jgi:hypothetical protein